MLNTLLWLISWLLYGCSIVVSGFVATGCLFGLIFMRHLDNTAEIYVQVKNLGMVLIVTLSLAGAFAFCIEHFKKERRNAKW